MDQRELRKPQVPFRRGPRLRLSRHPAAPDPQDPSSVRHWLRSVSAPTAIDLFCGAGGLSYGLQEAGFTVLVGADLDALAMESYVANLGGLGYLGDLSDPGPFLKQLRSWGIRSVDLVAGGIPCQPFSRAGRAKIRDLVAAGVRPEVDPRTALWQPFTQVVAALRPRLVLLENVPDLAVWDDGFILTQFRESLREIGYRTQVNILNAFDYGVPQHRARLFVVGIWGIRPFSWPLPQGFNVLRDAIGDLPPVPPAHRGERTPYDGPKSALQQRLHKHLQGEDVSWIYDHITRDVRSDDAEAFALLGEGQTYADLPSHLQRYRSDIFTDKYNRLRYDDLSRSITAHMAKDAYWYIHPEQDRTLSIREAARIQTFPDHFRFAGEPSHQYRQIGNAVPPLLAEALGQSLYACATSRARTGPRPLDGRTRLTRWYDECGRTFPWREHTDPWTVLVSEMCLRRTRADQVGRIVPDLLLRYPSPLDLLADPEGVHAMLTPLGLRGRTDDLIALAHALVCRHGGAVPATYEELTALPGVGPYVAGAVLCFAFHTRAVLVDTNTRRVMGRVYGTRLAKLWELRVALYDFAGAPGPDRVFNYALLDLAALVCHPRHPACHQCPIRETCQYFWAGAQRDPQVHQAGANGTTAMASGPSVSVNPGPRGKGG